MQLSPDAIKDFKAIYRTEYSVELSDAEAEEKARNLSTLFRVIARQLPYGVLDKHWSLSLRHADAFKLLTTARHHLAQISFQKTV